MQISAPAITSEANSTNINHHQTSIDNNNNQIIFNLQNMSGTVPPDPSPSPPIKSSTLTTATATTSSTKIYSSPNMNNNYNNNNSGTSALELLDSSPVRIRTINNSATTSLSTNQHVAVKSTQQQQQYGEGMNPHSSSSTAPPPTPPTSHQYPIPTRMNFNSSPHEIKNSRIHSSEHVSIEDNFKQNSIESNVREQYGKSEHTQHQHNKYQQYGNNNIYQSPNEGFIGRQHEEEEYHRTAQHHQWDYPYHHSSQRLSSWDQSPSSLSSSPLMSSSTRGKLSEQNNNLSSAEIQKEQANFVYGNNQKNSLKRTHGSSAATTTGSVEKAEAEEYYHHSHPQQQHYRTHSLPAYSRDIRTSIHHQEVKPVQNNNNPSVQIINQKNTSTSPLIFATGSSSPQVPTQHHQVYGRNSGHNYYHNQYQQQQQYDKENNRYIVERNNYYQATPSLQHTSSIETQPASLKQVSSSTTHSNIMQQPFIIQPSMQPSSGIPSFQHQVHSSNAATNPNSFHVPSNYQQHHHHSQQQQHYQPPPQPSSNYLNAQQQQQQSSYSSPNSNQPNSSEPKLRVYNSNLKVPEGIFSYDNTTLTCEPHGFKPNDRRGAPQTTHSVYVSDVLVVSCDLVAMANQPGIFQNCTARLVHLMGKNAKKKRKEGGSDQQDDGLDSEDDDMEDGKKKKKKNKKKEQEDSLDGDFMTDFSQAGMLESFELLSEQPCQENVQKGKIVSSLKVPRVRGRDCKTKTGQIQVLRFKGTEREHIIAVSDLFWIRSRTRTEMEVRKFKKQQQQSQPSHPQPPQQQIQQPPQHEPSNLSLHHHPQHSHHPQHPQPQQVPSNLNPPRENFHNSQWPNIVQPNSPSTNDHAVVPLKKRRNNSPGGGTPNSYRVPPNPAASIVHSSSYFPPSSNIPPISHQDNGKLHNHHDTPPHHISYQQHQPSRTEPTYQELLQRVHMLEEKLNRLESKLTRTGHISPDFPLPDSQISPFLPSSAIHPRPVEPPKTSSFTPFPIDVFIKDDKRGENPALPSVVSSDSQPAIFNPKSPLPSFPFDPSDSFLKNSFSPPGFANPTSSSSSESGKREH